MSISKTKIRETFPTGVTANVRARFDGFGGPVSTRTLRSQGHTVDSVMVREPEQTLADRPEYLNYALVIAVDPIGRTDPPPTRATSHHCPLCSARVTEIDSDTVRRAVGSFLTLGQFETLTREIDTDGTGIVDELCVACLVRTMAGAV